MNEIELYDIISLKNGKDYTVIKILENNNKIYFILARVDENKNIDTNDIRIVEEIEKSGRKFVKEVDDDDLTNKLIHSSLDY